MKRLAFAEKFETNFRANNGVVESSSGAVKQCSSEAFELNDLTVLVRPLAFRHGVQYRLSWYQLVPGQLSNGN